MAASVDHKLLRAQYCLAVPLFGLTRLPDLAALAWNGFIGLANLSSRLECCFEPPVEQEPLRELTSSNSFMCTSTCRKCAPLARHGRCVISSSPECGCVFRLARAGCSSQVCHCPNICIQYPSPAFCHTRCARQACACVLVSARHGCCSWSF